MKIMHLLSAGGTGGIEVLLANYAMATNLDSTFVFIWSGGPCAEKIRQAGKKVILLNGEDRNGISLLYRVMETFKNEKPDIVVDHYGAPLTRYAVYFMKKVFPQIKLISYMHSCAEGQRGYGNFAKAKLVDAANWLAFRKTDRVIAISQYVKNSTINYFNVLPEKIEVIYNGADIHRFYSSEKRSGTDVVYVGRLIAGKGVQNTLAALSKLEGNWHMDIIGDGPYRGELDTLCKKLGVQEKVTFWGSRGDVERFLSDASIFVHVPDMEEGFGVSVVEAMAAGLTCICNKKGGLPEIIENGTDGYLVDDNADELKNILCTVMESYHSSLNRKIRENAVRKAERFAMANFVKTLDMYLQGM